MQKFYISVSTKNISNIDSNFQALQRSYSLESLYKFIQPYYYDTKPLVDLQIDLNSKVDYWLGLVLFSLSYEALDKKVSEEKLIEDLSELVVSSKDEKKVLHTNLEWITKVIALNKIYLQKNADNQLVIPHYNFFAIDLFNLMRSRFVYQIFILVCVILVNTLPGPDFPKLYIPIALISAATLSCLVLNLIKHAKNIPEKQIKQDVAAKTQFLHSLSQFERLANVPEAQVNLPEPYSNESIEVQTINSLQIPVVQAPTLTTMFLERGTVQGASQERITNNSSRHFSQMPLYRTN